jgi:hypothetical protein
MGPLAQNWTWFFSVNNLIFESEANGLGRPAQWGVVVPDAPWVWVRIPSGLENLEIIFRKAEIYKTQNPTTEIRGP